MLRDFRKAVRELRRAVEDAFDPYRPEQHYMRGPGPKCHAKYAGRATDKGPLAAGTAIDFAKVPA